MVCWTHSLVLHASGQPADRTTDRLEALAVLAAVLTALIAIPAAAQQETWLTHRRHTPPRLQAHDRHPVHALVVTAADARRRMSKAMLSGVPLQSRRSGTREREWRTDRSQHFDGQAGESLDVWLDGTGSGRCTADADDPELSAAVASGLCGLRSRCGALAVFLIRRGAGPIPRRAWTAH